MINLLVFIGAIIIAFRTIKPLLRLAIRMLAKIVGFGFLIAIGILLLTAVLSHGLII